MSAPKVDIGRSRIVSTVDGVTGGWQVKPPKWAGDSEQRVGWPGPITVTVHDIGVVIRVNGTPAFALNSGDVEALGVALIKLSARL